MVSEKSGINCILSLLTRSLPTNVEDGARGTKPMQGILEKNLVMDSNCIIQRQIVCSKYLCFAIEIALVSGTWSERKKCITVDFFEIGT